MTLSPIRGAPPCALVPDFPAEEQHVGSTTARATSASDDQRQLPRPSYTPIEIAGGGLNLTFRVIPEQPAISRASMIVQVVVDPVRSSRSETIGFLKMSAAYARVFLTDLRDERSPIVVRGDEDGTVEVAYEITEDGSTFLVRKPGHEHALHRWVIEPSFDVKTMATELLADLGA